MLGALGLKFYKVSASIMSVALSVFDLYELMATQGVDDEANGLTGNVKKTVKEWLPQLHGTLPERMEYYAAKDSLHVASAWVIDLLFVNPVTGFYALYQTGRFLVDFTTNKHVDDALSAALQNMRFVEKEIAKLASEGSLDDTSELKVKRNGSLANIRRCLSDSWKPLASDSKVVFCARKLFFSEEVSVAYREKRYDQVLQQTTLLFGNRGCRIGIPEFEAYELLGACFIRFELLVEKHFSSDSEYSKQHYDDDSKELAAFNSYLSQTEAAQQGKLQKELETLDSLSLQLYAIHNAKMLKAALHRCFEEPAHCLASYEDHSKELQEFITQLEQKEKAGNSQLAESVKSYKELASQLLAQYGLAYRIAIVCDLLDRQEYEKVLELTPLTFNAKDASCTIHGDIELPKGITLFFKRCEALLHLLLKKGEEKKAYHRLSTVLKELEWVEHYLSTEAAQLPAGVIEALKSWRSLFVETYCASFIQEVEGFTDSWELFVTLDLVKPEERTLTHWYAYHCGVAKLPKLSISVDSDAWLDEIFATLVQMNARSSSAEKSRLEQQLSQEITLFSSMFPSMHRGQTQQLVNATMSFYEASSKLCDRQGVELVQGQRGYTAQLLAERLQPHFQWRPVKPDGDCFFRSVALQLDASDVEAKMLELRRSVADYMREHRETYESKVEGDFEDHLNQISTSSVGKEGDGGWGEYLHAEVLSHLLQRPIHLYAPFDRDIEKECDGFRRPLPSIHCRFNSIDLATTTAMEPIRLFYNGYDHWDALMAR